MVLLPCDLEWPKDAEAKGLRVYRELQIGTLPPSASFLAELSVSSPRKLFIFIILKKNLDQSIQKIFYLILKKEALLPPWCFKLLSVAVLPF